MDFFPLGEYTFYYLLPLSTWGVHDDGCGFDQKHAFIQFRKERKMYPSAPLRSCLDSF
jgi:hypothetical protein